MGEKPLPERVAVAERDIEDLQENRDKMWDKLGKITDTLSNLRVQVATSQAVIGIIQTVVFAFIVWKMTKGN